MIRPSEVSSAATAMMRWNEVIGLPSQAPNRVRGAPAAAASAVFASAVPVRRSFSRVRMLLIGGYRAARTAAAKASPRSA